MKVLHLISSGGMYGAEAVILNLSAQLNAIEGMGSSLGVFLHSADEIPALHEAAKRANVRSALISCRGQFDLSVAGSIRKLAAKTGAEVVHAHGYKADMYSFFSLRGRSRPALVSTCHTWYDNDLSVRAYGAADRFVLRFFDEVIAVSAEVETRLTRAGVSREKVCKIRNGIDVRPFGTAASGRFYRPIGTGPLRVGLVGRLAPEKGVDVFLRAAAQVSGRLPEVDFVVAGDGPDRAALETLLNELGLRGRAHLLGPQNRMADLYASLDLLVSASRLEGLPMALLEGMSSGLPVVATRVGAVSSIVSDKETGLLVSPDDPEQLSEAIVSLLQDASRRESFGRAGQQRVTAEFSAQRMAQEYIAAYQNALSRRMRSRPARETQAIG